MSESNDAVDVRADGDATLRIDPAHVRELSQLNPAVPTAHVLGEWLAILSAAWLSERYWHPLSYLLVVVFIGARQHSLATLMHEAAHYRICKNKRLNDWIGDAVLTWPFVILSMRAYRTNHFAHHNHLNTDRDPDWVAKRGSEWSFPQSHWSLIKLLATDMVGVGFLKFLLKVKSLPRASKKAQQDDFALKLGRILFVVIATAAIIEFDLGRVVALYWLVPFLTWLQVALHVRSIAEHFAVPSRAELISATRSVELTLLDRLFIMSNDTSLHVEHHLYPSVPFYRLHALHALIQASPDLALHTHTTRGYFNMLRECTKMNNQSQGVT